MKIRWKWLSSALSFASAVTISSISAITTPAVAAETVVVRRGIMSVSIPVKDLRTATQTSQVPISLLGYFSLLPPQQRAKVIGALKTHVKLNPSQVQSLLSTQIGSTILSEISTITPQTELDESTALKEALIATANQADGLSILGFLEAYPGSQFNVDVDQAFNVFRRMNTSFWETQRFMLAITEQMASPSPRPTLPFDPTQPGSASVQKVEFNFNDTARNRQIPVDLYLPSVTTPDKPLIVYTHGRGSNLQELKYLMEHLASYGFPVAVLEHPRSNEAYIKQQWILPPQEFLDRPKDISFVLDELEKLNQTNYQLKGKLNPNKTLVIGYSLGGATALSIAGAELQLDELRKVCQGDLMTFNSGKVSQCLAGELPGDRYQLGDPRIKSVIAIAPTASVLFGKTGLSQIKIPTLIFTASADKVTPALTEQILTFSQVSAPKWLVGVLGATHLSVKDPNATNNQLRIPKTPLSGGEVVGEQAKDIRNYVKAFTLAMAQQLTPESEKYQVFLTPEYYQMISTSAFPVRLVRDIPPSIQGIIETYTQK